MYTPSQFFGSCSAYNFLDSSSGVIYEFFDGSGGLFDIMVCFSYFQVASLIGLLIWVNYNLTPLVTTYINDGLASLASSTCRISMMFIMKIYCDQVLLTRLVTRHFFLTLY